MKYAYRTSLLVDFAQAETGVVSAEETIPVFYERWDRRKEFIEARTALTATALARVWAESVIAEDHGDLQPVPLGRGFARGMAAVIDAGDRLIQAIYSDGAPLDGPGMNLDEREAEIARKTRGILLQLGN